MDYELLTLISLDIETIGNYYYIDDLTLITMRKSTEERAL